MKGSKKLHEVQDEYKESVVGLCSSCKKPVKGGWYGANQEGGTCNKTCEEAFQKLPRYPNYSEEDFLERFPNV